MSRPACDFVARFLFEALDIRGAFVRLGATWRSMLAGRDYAPVVRDLLGEMAATTVLIAGNLKQPARLSVQLQSNGPLRLLVVDCHDGLRLRGMAQAADAPAAQPVSIAEMFGDGRLSLILQPDAARAPWQSLVPLAGASIAEVFEHYLAQSEQQPARLWLAADGAAACGLFLQKLPQADQRDADGWARLTQLAATVRAHEMRTLPARTLLRRLFPEEDIRLFAPRAVSHDCPHDRDKALALLRTLGRVEIESILAEQGGIVVHDDICNHVYHFDAGDLDGLFAPAAPQQRILH